MTVFLWICGGVLVAVVAAVLYAAWAYAKMGGDGHDV